VNGRERGAKLVRCHRCHSPKRRQPLLTCHNDLCRVERPHQPRFVLIEPHGRNGEKRQSHGQRNQLPQLIKRRQNQFLTNQPGQGCCIKRHGPRHRQRQQSQKYGLLALKADRRHRYRRNQQQQEWIGQAARGCDQGRQLQRIEHKLRGRFKRIGQPLCAKGERQPDIKPRRTGNDPKTQAEIQIELEQKEDGQNGECLPRNGNPA